MQTDVNLALPIVSVIIPVYNTGPYLRRCIDSLLSFDSSEIEVVLIDDGSTDESSSIIKEYALRDERVVAMYKENGGLSSARNAGLSISRGEYVGFVDSDDYVSVSYFMEFFNALRFGKPDIIIGGRYSDNCGSISNEFNCVKGFMNQKEVLDRILVWDNLDASVCDKIFRKVLFKDVLFQLGVYSEDLPVFVNLVQRASSIYHVGTEVYYYFKRANSITTGFFSDKMISVLYSLRNVYDLVNKDIVQKERLVYFMSWHYARFGFRFWKLSLANRCIFRRNLGWFLTRISTGDILANAYLLPRDKFILSLFKLLS
jgi:glycosyltransferase involved in cell wall biosynthesis